jgi:SAM-dependent methyltransferase
MIWLVGVWRPVTKVTSHQYLSLRLKLAESKRMPEQEPDPYAAIAEWYDVEHDGVTEDIECYQELIAGAVGERAAVLEIGSGSGRIAAALALAGHTVTGIEPSAAMRARCERRLAELPERVARRVSQRAGSATAPGLAEDARFDVILFGCNTFAHLLTWEERRRALVALRAWLRSAGVLLLDVDVAGPRRMAETVGQVWCSGMWTVPRSPLTLAHFSTALEPTEPDSVRVLHWYDRWEAGGELRRETARMTLALLDPSELERLVGEAGYAITARYGSHELEPWEEEAPRAIIIASAERRAG